MQQFIILQCGKERSILESSLTHVIYMINNEDVINLEELGCVK